MRINNNIVLTAATAILLACSGEEKEAKKPENNVSQETNEQVQPENSKTYEVVAEESFIKWTGSKPTEDHYGKVRLLPSPVEISGNLVKGGDLIVDMNSLTVEDIKDEEKNAKLLGHLKNQDFFSVEEYPEAQFMINESMANDTARLVIGELMIKGISQPAEIRYDIKRNGDVVVLEGVYVFDRTLYDIKYKSKTVFGDLGDKFINDEIKLEFNIVLKAAKDAPM